MARIVCIRLPFVAADAATKVLVYPFLSKCRLRGINGNNLTTACRISIGITPTGQQELLGFQLASKFDQSEAGIDVSWQGDLPVESNQQAYVYFENCQVADQLFMAVMLEFDD